MLDYNKLSLLLIQLQKYNNNNRYINKINEIQKILSNLNIKTNKDKMILLNLLIKYKINSIYFNFYINLFNIYNIKLPYYGKPYNDCIHNYLYYKIYLNYNIIFNKIDNIQEYLIKYQNEKQISNNIINETLQIDNFIDKYNFLEIINNENILYFDKLNEYIDKDYKQKIIISNKINYPLTLTQYYDNDILNTYQCWFKSAINFFINNGKFLNKFVVNLINKEKKYSYNDIINKLYDSTINDININSDIIESEKIYGGNNTEIYELFVKMFQNNDNDINNYYIELKRLLNEKLNNKYYLGIPGYKMYPFYVIQDILILLNDSFTNDCIIEYYNNYMLKDNIKSYIYDCNTNYILNDLLLLYDDQYNNDILDISELDYNNLKLYKKNKCIDEEYNNSLCNNKLSTIPFNKLNNKYYFEDNIINYIKFIKNNPINLLIACPIHDIISIYLLNNKIKFPKYDYNIIHNYMDELYNMYDIKIIYPFNIIINDKKYYLHSFIICVNNYSIYDELKIKYKNVKKIDSHFIYYKIDYSNKEQIDLLRYDTFKSRLNKNIINEISNNLYFIKEEFNNLYNDNYIKDNLNYKVIFCYYRRIN